MSSWWVTGFSTGSLKLTSWTPSDGEDQLWSLLWSAPQTEPLPSTGWFMAAHWCAQRANSSGTRLFLNAMNGKPSLELKMISKDPWQTEFWLLCVLFVVLSEAWIWPHVHRVLMISLLWGVGLPLTLQMALPRLLQSLHMNQHDLRLHLRQPLRWKLNPLKRLQPLQGQARMMTRPTWTSWQRNVCQHPSRAKTRALRSSQFTNGRRLHPLDFGQNLLVKLRNQLGLLINRWTSRSQPNKQRSEIDSQQSTLASWNLTTTLLRTTRNQLKMMLIVHVNVATWNRQSELPAESLMIAIEDWTASHADKKMDKQSQNNPRLKSSISLRSQRRRFCRQWSKADLALKRRRRSQKPNERLSHPGLRTMHGEL